MDILQEVRCTYMLHVAKSERGFGCHVYRNIHKSELALCSIGSDLTNAIKDPSNVALLLEILEKPDFYVRFNSIQLLSTLLNNNPTAVQDCVLSSPMGISR